MLDAIRAAAAGGGRVVVTAPPGSGKTTRIPPALAASGDDRVVVLEPRRVAARAVAGHLAAQRGEPIGGFVGLTTRDEHRVGEHTRVEFVTEGVLTRRLQRDPELRGVGTVVFDEFHERSLQADLGLALTLDTASALRPDLSIVVMSATIDAAAVAALLGGAPVIEAPGRVHPVRTLYRPPGTGTGIAEATTAAVGEALSAHDGDVLVFLAGAPEIRLVGRLLGDRLPPAWRDRIDVWPLHGALAAAEQDRALGPAPAGRRKVVLATNVAETSLTVPGVRTVVDSGQVRRARPSSGGPGRFTQLQTERVSLAEADQRQGRAGREGPGVCYRLWAETDLAGLRAAPPPEITTADLTSLALELAGWGVADPAALAWSDPPAATALADARRTLAVLGLLDTDHRPTGDGRRVLQLGVDPRAGAMLLAGRRAGALGVRIACRLVALLEEGDPFRPAGTGRFADLGVRLDALDGLVAHDPGGAAVDVARLRRIERRAQQLHRRMGRAAGHLDGAEAPAPAQRGGDADRLVAGLLLAGMADRVAQRRDDGGGRYLLRHGGGVRLAGTDPLSRSPFLVVADAGGAAPGAGGRTHDLEVRLATALPAELLPPGERRLVVRWDPTIGDGGDVSARYEERLDALVVRAGPAGLDEARAVDAVAALLDGVRARGLSLLGNVEAGDRLRERVDFCRRVLGPDGWPDLGTDTLLRGLDEWLPPWLAGARRRRDLARVDCRAVWWAMLSPAARTLVDRAAPTQVVIPTGRAVQIDYGPERPVLSVKLQELFGLRELPELALGRQRLRAELLSPAGRPVAVTDDLERFWNGAYREVRAEMRGRYPKHPWPEDPLTATATAATNRRTR